MGAQTIEEGRIKAQKAIPKIRKLLREKQEAISRA
jgi:hypothetical protein